MQDSTENVLEREQPEEVVPERKKLPPLVFILAKQSSLLREVEDNYGEITEEVEEELEATKELFNKKWPSVLFVKDSLESEIAIIEKYIENAKSRIKARQNRINILEEGLIAGIKLFGQPNVDKKTGVVKSYFIIDEESGRKLNVLTRDKLELNPNFETYVRSKILTKDLEDDSIYYAAINSSVKLGGDDYIILTDILRKRREELIKNDPNVQESHLKAQNNREVHFINLLLQKLEDFTVIPDKKALLTKLKEIEEHTPNLFTEEDDSTNSNKLLNSLASVIKNPFLK